tara:strand:+ start:136 stop:600 length:465 start_codon:yes stop_codon:yes gene_type:complete
MRKLILYTFILFSIQTSAQTICDSVSYTISDSQALTLIGNNNSSDSVVFMWGVCDSDLCYSADGDTGIFPHVNIFDTVKVCYNISPAWTCETCQNIIFLNGSWHIIDEITYINEIYPVINDNKIYDILGNELHYTPVGKIYIRNNRPYLRILLE